MTSVDKTNNRTIKINLRNVTHVKQSKDRTILYFLSRKMQNCKRISDSVFKDFISDGSLLINSDNIETIDLRSVNLTNGVTLSLSEQIEVKPKRSTRKKTVAKKPVTKEPVTKETVAKKAVAKKAVAKETITKEAE